MIAIVVAKAENNVIGSKNDLPWYLPADLRHFKSVTTGHTVVMGRHTFESIYNRLQGPLPNRRNIVVSRSLDTIPTGFELARSVDEAISMAKESSDDCFIIGGQQIYSDSLERNLVDTIYLTEVHAAIEGDTIFSTLDPNLWQEVSREDNLKDDKNPYNYSFIVLKRKV